MWVVVDCEPEAPLASIVAGVCVSVCVSVVLELFSIEELAGAGALAAGAGVDCSHPARMSPRRPTARSGRSLCIDIFILVMSL